MRKSRRTDEMCCFMPGMLFTGPHTKSDETPPDGLHNLHQQSIARSKDGQEGDTGNKGCPSSHGKKTTRPNNESQTQTNHRYIGGEIE